MVICQYLNALMKTGGLLIFSTPFLVQDHQVPHDYFRYTVKNVRRLLACGGFNVTELYGSKVNLPKFSK